MKLLKTNCGVVIGVHVKPDSKQFKITVETGKLVVSCREVQQNVELTES